MRDKSSGLAAGRVKVCFQKLVQQEALRGFCLTTWRLVYGWRLAFTLRRRVGRNRATWRVAALPCANSIVYFVREKMTRCVGDCCIEAADVGSCWVGGSARGQRLAIDSLAVGRWWNRPSQEAVSNKHLDRMAGIGTTES